jgi:hypothetical protein
MSTIRELLIVALVMACGSRSAPMSSPAPAEPAPTESPTPTEPAPIEQAPPPSLPSTSPQADGGPCLTSDDCTSGICEGQGCDDRTPGRCAPKQRGCTRDLRPFCGCDGVTFSASGACPGKRYKAKGACAATAP